jgi:hypothetical protein
VRVVTVLLELSDTLVQGWMTSTRTDWRSLTLLLAIVIGAIALRFAGIGVLLPHRTEPDPSVLSQAEYFSGGDIDGEISWGRYSKYPHLLARILAVADTRMVSR